MSIRLEMLQIARVAPKVLGDAAPLVANFLRRQQNSDGGFKDRDGRSDLYYTVFGLNGLIALRADLPLDLAREYLEQFDGGSGLDFVHLCCLARCLAAVSEGPIAGAEAIARRVLEHRAADGGFHPVPGNPTGTVYAGFLALGALQDLGVALPDPQLLLNSLEGSRTPDGVWANDSGVPVGSTNASAAAITILRQFQASIPAPAAPWLLDRLHAQGGFVAAPGAPLPDLLSTATALHALQSMEQDLGAIREGCLDFVDSLWTNAGGFHGHWADDVLDCEYTYYGLLALGHLSS